ncbi:MAG: NTP transferase domain-containing protein, partial [Actinobacteria bacterium]|nr:NTP transferase domain-containing protein [Actinomycetota bacterium]NIU65223.1 NTP transferase domain-containing protein [Actinomycetota bacterium]NIV86248.1 NTP transferase domain-containing protein [Actinomycetota bacterium]NIW27036.1 NTP transferase domain-containing protein [Actinomycetota bacterium]NIX19577.1 NTP transferase domain-containing protein [Actinomycetota bacterium]
MPIKPFAEAKQRLSSDLDGVQRRALAAMTASHVVMACHTAGLPVAVVTDDDEVAVWASERGCRIVADPGSGLSDAVAVAVDEVDGPWLAVHADLPLLA